MTGVRIHWKAPRRSALTIAAVVGIITLAGCSSSGSPSSAASSPAPAGSPPTPSLTSPGSTAHPATLAAAAVPAAVPAGVYQWLGYHSDGARTGAVAADPALKPTKRSWRADLGAAVYGQPVVASGRVLVGTEGNRAYALNPANGKVLWTRGLGTPLTNVAQVAGCGNIDPLGITSTPVVDTAGKNVYMVAEVDTGGGTVVHRLYGMSVATGAIVLQRNVDPPLPAGERNNQLLQRASLALANGRVYVGFGGNNGDCGHYHGWVTAMSTAGTGNVLSFEVASDGEGGAIWQAGGAPAVDKYGNLFVTTGNANPDPPQGGPDPKAYTESVVKLSQLLKPMASFKDTIAGGDEDLSTGNPVLLPNGQVFSIGKTDVAYILNQSDLSKVASIGGVCGSDPDGGPAYDAAINTVFVPCRGGGIQPVDLTTKTVKPKLAGANGAPILTGSTVWAAQYPDGTLTGFAAATGAKVSSLAVGAAVPTFSTPSAALGHLYLGTRTGVMSFN